MFILFQPSSQIHEEETGKSFRGDLKAYFNANLNYRMQVVIFPPAMTPPNETHAKVLELMP